MSVGDASEYTYTVTNTGTASLFDGGRSGDARGSRAWRSDVCTAELFMAPGDIETATKDYVVQASDLGTTITNTATASSDQAPDATANDSVEIGRASWRERV